MTIHDLFHETTQRSPSDQELFVFDGHIHVYRQMNGSWTDLGESVEEGVVPEVGSLQFELQTGIIAEGSPAFILRLLFRAFYRFNEEKSRDIADTCFNIFRECGWVGPIESENKSVPGTIKIDEVVQDVDDLRMVMAQLQDPNDNGWLQIERGHVTSFISIGRAKRIDIIRKEENGEDSHRPLVTD